MLVMLTIIMVILMLVMKTWHCLGEKGETCVWSSRQKRPRWWWGEGECRRWAGTGGRWTSGSSCWSQTPQELLEDIRNMWVDFSNLSDQELLLVIRSSKWRSHQEGWWTHRKSGFARIQQPHYLWIWDLKICSGTLSIETYMYVYICIFNKYVNWCKNRRQYIVERFQFRKWVGETD